jgi:hypothetical protein
MKKPFIIPSVLLLLILSGIGLWKLNKDFLLLWYSNSINVTTDNPLSINKVKIEFGISVNTISRSTDLDLFKNREKYTVLFDGNRKENMINDYGENDFLLTYDNKYYISFRQFKFNRRHQHDYNFHFFQKNGKLSVRADIKGEDEMNFERQMIEIRLADKFRCNTTIDSTKTIYNMVELVRPNDR